MKDNITTEKVIRVGSRKSELALIQTRHVITRLQKLYPNRKFEIHTMTTIGDRILNISLPKIGEKSLFTRDLEDALRNGSVDFVVHSLKDLPTILPNGMAIGAVLEREDARDALVLRNEFQGHTLNSLPMGSVIGTSSLRRTAQLRRQYPNIEVCDIRGNLNTRLAKLDAKDSKLTGIILAQAGLVRMGWMERISEILEPSNLLYAVGQGALAVECRQNDNEILEMLRNLMCLKTTCRILAERSFLKTLGGGCSAPVAVCTHFYDDTSDNNNKEANVCLHIDGAVWSLDGVTEIREKVECSLELRKLKKSMQSNMNQNNNDNDDETPVNKKTKLNDNDNNTLSTPSKAQGSSATLKTPSPPLVINDDAGIELISNRKDVKELVNKHLNIMKRDNRDNNCGLSNKGDRGAGDGDLGFNETLNSLVHDDIGTDVMGECPVVNNDTKVALEIGGKCPIKTVNEKIDWTALPTPSRCPFTTLLKQSNDSNRFNVSHDTDRKRSHLELDKSTSATIIDPYITNNNNKDNDLLFCGLYRHACINYNLYEKCNKLGEILAQKLIKQGALTVMKSAQAEIHAKS